MPNVYSLVPTWVGVGQVWQNVLHFQLDESGTGTPAARAAALSFQFLSSQALVWADCLSQTVELRSLRAKRVTGGGGPTTIQLLAAGDLPGTRADNVGTTMEAGLLEFPVLLAGKNVTGKIFIGGLPDDGIEENSLSSVLTAAVDALGDSMLVPLTLAGGLGTAHYTIFNRATGADTIPASHFTSVYIGNQRRRITPPYDLTTIQ